MARHVFRKDQGSDNWIDTGELDETILNLSHRDTKEEQEKEFIEVLEQHQRDHGNDAKFEIREVDYNEK